MAAMKLADRIAEVRAATQQARGQGRKIALVPTMGAIHEGHLSLVRRARELSDFIATSIFVNPLQFGPHEDFERYPRDLARDCQLLEREGVELVFAPSVEELYPRGFTTYVEVKGLSDKLEGRSRPGHFRGVTTVVLKLLNIFSPDLAFFGQKDAQQAIIIKCMARDLDLPVEIVVCPTVREADGLACSSRNRYLSAEERRAATVLYRALRQAEKIITTGEQSSAKIIEGMRGIIEAEPLARIDYIAVTDLDRLEPCEVVSGGALISLAVFIGNTRLLDNIVV